MIKTAGIEGSSGHSSCGFLSMKIKKKSLFFSNFVRNPKSICDQWSLHYLSNPQLIYNINSLICHPLL